MRPAAPRHVHDRREAFDALRWIARTGAPLHYLPTNFPPWEADYQQTRRWGVKRSFARANRFRRRVGDYERLLQPVADSYFAAFNCLMLYRFVTAAAQSP